MIPHTSPVLPPSLVVVASYVKRESCTSTGRVYAYSWLWAVWVVHLRLVSVFLTDLMCLLFGKRMLTCQRAAAS